MIPHIIQNSKLKIQNSIQRGFSLLELLIVIAIVAVIGTIGAGSYRNFGKTVELTSTAQMIASDLKQMQSKSMIGERGYKWGVRFEKASPNDRYMTFSTLTDYASGTTTSTTTLSNGITFSDPATGFKDIIFNKISGTISAATTTVVTSEGVFATTTVTSVGAIY